MLERLFGSRAAELVLLFLENYERGYGREIANTFNLSINQVQKQLKKFEEAGILVSTTAGRTRLYTWNRGNPLVKPLRDLLSNVLDALPAYETEKYYRQRRRPRKASKPL